MSLVFHITYIGAIVVLLLLLAIVWASHIKNGVALLRVNCVAAEMLLDQSRYDGIKKHFFAFLEDERQPLNRNPPEKADYEANRIYWLSTAYQLEKVTQTLMVSECQNDYEGLALAMYRYSNR